jgi:biotin carboxylase
MDERLEHQGKRIIIVGASILQIPAIIAAKEMGLYVGVVDYNPQAPGVKLADEYFNVSTIDSEGLLEVAISFRTNGIMTLATDMPMKAIAYVCNRLGLTCISEDTARLSTHKGEMIKAFERFGVSRPWYYLVDNVDQLSALMNQIEYPCIMKPVDSSGSRGVTLIHGKNHLIDAFSYATKYSTEKAVVIEEFLEGQEVSVEVLVFDGIVNVIAITDKITTGPPHFVELGHSQPSVIDDDNQDKIKQLAIKAVKSVGITQGPAHVEMMLTKNGPKMIELGARLGGDCITSHLVPLSTGVNIVKESIKIALSEKPCVQKTLNKAAIIRYFQAQIGTIRSIKGIEEAQSIPGVIDIALMKKIGDSILEIENSLDRVGYIVVQGQSLVDAQAIFDIALYAIKIE